MKNLLLLLITISVTFSITLGQDEEPRKNIYSFVPQYLINRGIRIDIEKQLSERHFLQICPQFYLSERDDDNFINTRNQFTYLVGGGLGLYDKIFASGSYKDYGLYFSYGLSYNYFYIEYIDDSNQSEISAYGNIHKIGADLILGYQFFVRDLVSIDIYTGVGTRVSSMNANDADTDRFNTGFFGYNYTGNLLVLGLRLGVIL
jgi:hypothetical protein